MVQNKNMTTTTTTTTKNTTARVFLEKIFGNGSVGHTTLVMAACALVDGFCQSFRFNPSEIASARASASNLKGIVEQLMITWYSKCPSADDLRVNLTRWNHTELLV